MSFFLYNQNGDQAIARPYLDGMSLMRTPGPSPSDATNDMSKFHTQVSWDRETNAPSINFVYDFDVYRFWVQDSWEEVFSNDENGEATTGSLETLVEAFSDGREVKVAVSGLANSLTDGESDVEHEVYVQVGSCYYYSEQKLFMVGSHPVVRVKPGVPVIYESNGWDFGWLMLRTDGRVVYRRCDPYTLSFDDRKTRHSIRWFVR